MRWFIGTIVALFVAIVIYVGSAVVSLSGLVEAARAGDATGVLERTDTVRVRRSLVDQIVTAYLKQIGQDRTVKPLERLAADTVGATIADAAILKTGTINSGAGPVDVQRLTEIDTSEILKTLGRISVTKPVEFLIRIGENQNAGGISIHFEGSGWKLSGIQLPASAVQSLAQDLVKSRARSG
jgi:hypothetical protein